MSDHDDPGIFDSLEQQMSEHFNAAAEDETRQALGQVAQRMGIYYSQLITVGLPEKLASRLVEVYHHTLVSPVRIIG